MEVEMFNTLLGPLVFAMAAGLYGYFVRPEKRDQLLLALTLLLVFSGAVSYMYPSLELFTLLVPYALIVSFLFTLKVRQSASNA